MVTKVLFVGGTGRSGSTVLANLLGESERYVSVGEIRFLWDRGIRENRLCGCGEHFAECTYWRTVLAIAFPSGIPSPESVVAGLGERTRMRQLPAFLRGRSPGGGLSEVLAPLYSAIAQVADADVVVDSSKLPTYAALLGGIPELDVRLVHLVRDPRAAAFSWRRVKELPDKGKRTTMERRSVVKSAGLWVVWNAALEQMWRNQPERYHRVAYERFVAAPEAELRELMASLDLPGEPWKALTGPRTAKVSVHHTVAGNPSRMRRGSVTLALDDEWSSAMPSRDRATVELLTGPLMRRYGYDRHGSVDVPSMP